MVDAGEIFHPLRWTPQQALQFLKDVPALESAGVVVRMPASWRMNRPARPQVKATVGGKPPSQLGLDALLDFEMEVTLDGESLSAAEIKQLLAQSDGLGLIRGKWVEVDRERLSRTLEQFEAVERRAATDGLSFGEAMRMLAGAGIAEDERRRSSRHRLERDRRRSLAGGDARRLARPGRAGACRSRPSAARHAAALSAGGRAMAHLLAKLRLGACLADDMGLGKTIQVLSLLLVLKKSSRRQRRKPCLLVAPASLLANWAAEIERFAPSLRALVAHPSAPPADKRKTGRPGRPRRC